MKRTGRLPRRTPLVSSPLPPGETPRKPMRKVSKRRKGSLFPHRRDPKYRAWIRGLACLVDCLQTLPHRALSCDGPVECCHLKSRGAGGDDRANCFPACRTHHRHQHSLGIQSFQALYALDLAAVAAELGQRYEMDGGAF